MESRPKRSTFCLLDGAGDGCGFALRSESCDEWGFKCRCCLQTETKWKRVDQLQIQSLLEVGRPN
jgi:hypothetical protein